MSKKLFAIAATAILFVGCTTANTAENNTSSSASSTSQTTTNSTSTAAMSSDNDTFTLAEVSTHSSASDCWTTIDGKVYDLTSFIGRHPGGSKILQVCGKDGTSLFSNQPNHNPTADAELAKLYIGDLAN